MAIFLKHVTGIAAILLFQANAAWRAAGFLGIEVFFVIRGFILTRRLLAEMEQRRSPRTRERRQTME